METQGCATDVNEDRSHNYYQNSEKFFPLFENITAEDGFNFLNTEDKVSTAEAGRNFDFSGEDR